MGLIKYPCLWAVQTVYPYGKEQVPIVFDPHPLTLLWPLVEMGVVIPRLATNQFNVSSFFQGIPGNDGIPGKPGLPGYVVSKIREKRSWGGIFLLTVQWTPQEQFITWLSLYKGSPCHEISAVCVNSERECEEFTFCGLIFFSFQTLTFFIPHFSPHKTPIRLQRDSQQFALIPNSKCSTNSIHLGVHFQHPHNSHIAKNPTFSLV